jgi:hypothetical protein
MNRELRPLIAAAGTGSPDALRRRVRVEIAEPDKDPRAGWLLLPAEPDPTALATAVVRVFNEDCAFVSFVEASGQRVVLVRLNIEWIALGRDSAPQTREPSSTERCERVQARFMDERRVDGTIIWTPSARITQLSDALNAAPDFFLMDTGAGPLIVNRHRLRELVMH